tara:strand:- start:204 stop:716 length:513 start_codon:yes stop_codon:yes gene_type:complete
LILKKKIFLIIIFFLLSFSKSWSKENIAFLDVELIINKSEPALKIIKKIEKLRNIETKKLKEIENGLSKKNEEILKTKNLISEEELKNKISDLRKEVNSFEELRRKIIKDLNIKKNNELSKFLKLIDPIVRKYMKENSIDIIIDKKNIFMARAENDITKDILQIINTEIK